MNASKKKYSLAAMTALMAGCLAMPAKAQLDTASDEPIDITGDQFEAFRDKDYAIWTGNVQVVQGTAILTAPKLTIYGIEDGELDRINATGGIRYTNGTEAISSRRAVYDAADETVTFFGDVVVVQDEQVLSGGRLIYYTSTGQIKFFSENGGRVRGIFISNNANPES